MSQGLFGNSVALLMALIAYAPENNVRVALISLLEFLSALEAGDEVGRDDLYEVIAQNLLWMHDHVSYTDDEPERSAANINEAVLAWRKQLGIEEDEK